MSDYMGELYPSRKADKELAEAIGYTPEDIEKNLPNFTTNVGDAFILVHELRDMYGYYFKLECGKAGTVADFYSDGQTKGSGQAHNEALAICRAFIQAYAHIKLDPLITREQREQSKSSKK